MAQDEKPIEAATTQTSSEILLNMESITTPGVVIRLVDQSNLGSLQIRQKELKYQS